MQSIKNVIGTSTSIPREQSCVHASGKVKHQVKKKNAKTFEIITSQKAKCNNVWNYNLKNWGFEINLENIISSWIKLFRLK